MCKTGKNNNSDNKLALVLRDASIVVLVCWSTFISRFAAKLRVVSPLPGLLRDAADQSDAGFSSSSSSPLSCPSPELGACWPDREYRAGEPRVDGGRCHSSDHRCTLGVAELQHKDFACASCFRPENRRTPPQKIRQNLIQREADAKMEMSLLFS